MPVALVAIMAASAIAQYMNSQQAASANKADMAKLQALYAKLQQPNFDGSTLTPEDYQVVGKYVPEVAPRIQEMNPTTIKPDAQMAQGQAAQRQALQQLQQVASSSNNPELAGMSNQALAQGQAAAQSRQASLMNQYARQGMLGSGVQLAGQLSAGEGAMQQASQAGQTAAMEAYRQRLAALGQSAQLGGQMVSQDAGIQGQNAAIINAFNQRMAQSGQNYADYAANTANQAQAQNLNAAQSVANMNTQQKNQYAIQQQAYQNQLKQMQYQNQLAALGQNTGMTQMNMGMNTQQAQDKNAAYQGLGNAATAGAMYYGQQQQNDAAAQRQQAQWDTQNSQNQQMIDYYTGKNQDDE